MSIILNKILKRHWLILLYLIWFLIGVLAFPADFLKWFIFIFAWAILGIIVLTGATLYKYANSTKSFILTIVGILIILPIGFITTLICAGEYSTALHKSVVRNFVDEFQETGLITESYEISDPKLSRLVDQIPSEDEFTIETEEFFFGNYTFSIHFIESESEITINIIKYDGIWRIS
ncbi:hypothetical protein [Candidatus Leptofilum sp.]|uniref:hypothetical protein n=1 Tax=Candidatus Leptofilum sp. TaxID=3241576 RepID=UPI003B5A58A1